jgi:hypothetical protein
MPSEIMIREITTNEYKSVGPYSDLHGHGPVIFIQEYDGDGITESIFTCLDCGYTTGDRRQLRFADCGRENNSVNQTMRELIEEEGYPE